MLYHERYQLAPAVTKNAPERNLQISFQLILIIKAYHKVDCPVHLNSPLAPKEGTSANHRSFWGGVRGGPFCKKASPVALQTCLNDFR